MSIFKVFLFSFFLIGASVASIDYADAKPTHNKKVKKSKKSKTAKKAQPSKRATVKKGKTPKTKKINGTKMKVSAVGNSIKIEELAAKGKTAQVCCQKSCEGYNVSCHAYNCKKGCQGGCHCGGSKNSTYGEFITE